MIVQGPNQNQHTQGGKQTCASTSASTGPPFYSECTSLITNLRLLIKGLAGRRSCTGGKTEDFMAAAQLLHRAGGEVKVPTYLVPATQKVRSRRRHRSS